MENFSLTRDELIQLTSDSFLITFNEDLNFEPTQFIMIETPTSIVRKPFGLGRWYGKLAIGVQVIGPGTKYIIEQRYLKAHGPCGKGFTPPSGKGAVIATPACLAIVFDMHRRFLCDVFIGSLEKLKIEVSFKTVLGDEEFVALLKSLKAYDWFFVVGSDQMEKVSYNLLKDKGQVFVSLNEYMACGVGACRGCAIETKHGLKHLCVDGPALRGEEVWN
ncbi:iron-sulfur cluster-binding protein [Pseudothermotoga sp.]|nr:oxidoreductase [Pseudothermotoga sp.]MCX7813538.1 oxidoreductase [Pseudothermotoga sp.]MDW8140541.1 oxidoreductase [Pseudothermotoga sp.]